MRRTQIADLPASKPQPEARPEARPPKALPELYIDEWVNSLATKWAISKDDVLTLLFYFSGKEQMMNEALIQNESTRARVLSEAGVESVFKPCSPNPTCLLCLENNTGIIARRCGHGCCAQCWFIHLKTSVSALRPGAAPPGLKCPGEGCTLTLPVSFVLSILKDHGCSAECQAYELFIRQFFTLTSSSTFCCPMKGCTAHIEPTAFPTSVIKCTKCCGNICLSCRHKAHEPIPCSSMRSYYRAKEDYKASCVPPESQTNQPTMSPSIKPCPVCKAAVKIQTECTSVFCGICNSNFCWRCLRVEASSGQVGSSLPECQKRMCPEAVLSNLSRKEEQRMLEFYEKIYQPMKKMKVMAKEAAQLVGLRTESLSLLLSGLIASTPSSCNPIACMDTFYEVNKQLSKHWTDLRLIWCHAYALDVAHHKRDMVTYVEREILPLYHNLQQLFTDVFAIQQPSFDCMDKLLISQTCLNTTLAAIKSSYTAWLQSIPPNST